MQRFKEPLHPDAKDVLVFDFSAVLPAGVTLTGAPSVSVAMAFGVDASPSSLLTGGAQVDTSGTKVLVPVQGRVDGADYAITCECPSTEPKIECALTAVLEIRR